jgi:prepilin-type N-terminal cleavage/methylation domain-containing protein
MKNSSNQKGFSLTELLIVMVVVALLFAAIAPILAKKLRASNTATDEMIWTYVKNDDNKDAFFDSGVPSLLSTAYIGLNPKSLALLSKEPYSKVVIKANKDQNHIQFRYGQESDGAFGGLLSLDNNNNVFMTSKLYGSKANNYKTFQSTSAEGNTVAGIGAFAQVSTATNYETAIGAGAVLKKGFPAPTAHNTSVGINSNQYAKANESVLIGGNTGRSETAIGEAYTVAIGASSLGLPTSLSLNSTLLGYYVGATGFGLGSNSSGPPLMPTDNVIIGSQYYGASPQHNTIIGNGTYVGGSPDAKYLTAVGANSCASIQNSATSTAVSGINTCIGYDTAKNYGAYDATKNLGWNFDGYDHIYIGGSPYGFGGRSVLEIHNIPKQTSVSNPPLPDLGPTVVLNSNLVVRGNTYFPNASGVLINRTTQPVVLTNKQEASYDTCRRKCMGGSHKWRTGKKCSGFLHLLIGDFIYSLVGSLLGSLGSAFTFTVGALNSVSGSVIDSVLGVDSDQRLDDPFSYSFLFNGSTCANSSTNYVSGGVCPNLLLSDERLKNIQVENKDSIASILHLMPYNYTFKNDEKSVPQVGVMAQDLQNVFPNDVEKDKDGYLKIRWDGIFFATINSVKDLNTQVKTAENNLNKINDDTIIIKQSHKDTKKRISELNKRIKKLEK